MECCLGVPHKTQSINIHEGRDCLTSIQNYVPLMRFIDLNSDINNIHKRPQGG